MRQSCCVARLTYIVPTALEFSAILTPQPFSGAGLQACQDTTPDYIDLATRRDSKVFCWLKKKLKGNTTFQPTRAVYPQMLKAFPDEELAVAINPEIGEFPAFQSFL